MSYNRYPLFKGATRAATYWGLPFIPIICLFIVVASISMILTVWFYITIPIIWFIMAQITRHDDKAFHILALWIETKFRNHNKEFWGASSYSPCNYKKRNE